MRLVSKTGVLQYPDERIYNFLSNFNNFNNLIPKDKIQDWQSDENSCSFRINPVGAIGIKIIEKEPFKFIKFTNSENSGLSFNFWVQLKKQDENTTYVKLTLDVQLNRMLEMLVSKPLQEFLDKLVDEMGRYRF